MIAGISMLVLSIATLIAISKGHLTTKYVSGIRSSGILIAIIGMSLWGFFVLFLCLLGVEDYRFPGTSLGWHMARIIFFGLSAMIVTIGSIVDVSGPSEG